MSVLKRSQAVATQRMPAPQDGTGSARGVDAPGAVGLPPSSLMGSLRFQGSVEDQIYAMGWPITPLILPPASGGNGLLIYTFDPAVPGLTFDAQERTLNRAPVEAGRRHVTYTVSDGRRGAEHTFFTITIRRGRARRIDIEVPRTRRPSVRAEFGVSTHGAASQPYWSAQVLPLLRVRAFGPVELTYYALC